MKEKQESKRGFAQRHIVWVLAAVLVISLLPLYLIAFYNHPSVDDYYYGTSTHQVWEETGSVSDVIKEAARVTGETYENWQGNFTAIFLMTLQPGIFSEGAYAISGFLLVTAFAGSSFFFFICLFRRCLKAGWSLSLTAAIVLVFLSMQFTHMPSDAFYWYNGSIYYTFFYSLSLFAAGLCIVVWFTRRTAVKVCATIGAALLGFLIGGSNYCSALTAVILLVFLNGFLVYSGRGQWRALLRRALPYFVILAAVLASFLLSVLAPGNAVRQESVTGGAGVIKAILLSFAYGGYSAANAFKLPVVLGFLFLVPVFWKMAAGSGFRFPAPLLVIGLSFCFYSAQVTPVIFAQGIKIPYRIMNVIYFSFYLMLAVDLLYFLGWFRLYLVRHAKLDLWEQVLCSKFFNSGAFLIVFACVFGAACIGGIEITGDEESRVQVSGLPLSASAAYSLINGEAKKYDGEYRKRVALFEDETITKVTVPPFESKPYVLFHTDITKDPKHWKNSHVAGYYNKESVKLTDR